MLEPTGFGRLYTGWAVLNVLVAPISIVALSALQLFCRKPMPAKGLPSFPGCWVRIAAIALPWTAATVLVLEVLFYLGGRLIGVDSLALIWCCRLPPFRFWAWRSCAPRCRARCGSSLTGQAGFCGASPDVPRAVGLLLTRSPWGCFAGMRAASLSRSAVCAGRSSSAAAARRRRTQRKTAQDWRHTRCGGRSRSAAPSSASCYSTTPIFSWPI